MNTHIELEPSEILENGFRNIKEALNNAPLLIRSLSKYGQLKLGADVWQDSMLANVVHQALLDPSARRHLHGASISLKR